MIEAELDSDFRTNATIGFVSFVNFVSFVAGGMLEL